MLSNRTDADSERMWINNKAKNKRNIEEREREKKSTKWCCTNRINRTQWYTRFYCCKHILTNIQMEWANNSSSCDVRPNVSYVTFFSPFRLHSFQIVLLPFHFRVAKSHFCHILCYFFLFVCFFFIIFFLLSFCLFVRFYFRGVLPIKLNSIGIFCMEFY